MLKRWIVVSLLYGSSLVAAQQILTDDSVIKMAKAGLSDDLILSTINASPGMFDVTTDGLIALKRGGVSDRVVSALLIKSHGNAPSPSPRATVTQVDSSSENDAVAPPVNTPTSKYPPAKPGALLCEPLKAA